MKVSAAFELPEQEVGLREAGHKFPIPKLPGYSNHRTSSSAPWQLKPAPNELIHHKPGGKVGDGISPAIRDDDRLLAVHEALEKFAALEPQKAEVVKLRYFVGMTTEETAEALGISVPTADRYWAYSRAWLARQIRALR